MTESEFTTAQVHTKFLELESDLELFDLCLDGVPVWERVRFRINRRLLQRLNLIGSAGPDRSIENRVTPERVRNVFEGLTLKNPFLTRSTDVLVWGLPRRKQLQDGRYWDLYCDPIYEWLDLDYLHIEEPYRGKHRRPAKTTNIAYLDVLSLLERGSAWSNGLNVRLGESVTRRLRTLKSTISEEFGVTLDVRSVVRKTLQKRAVRKPLYKTLLGRVQPSVVLLVKSYGKETFIETCKEATIPTAELQHGALSRYHLGYSYPGDRIKESFPDYFFAFGRHFTSLAQFPIPDDHVYSVGYPYLEMGLEDATGVHRSTPRKDDGTAVLFLSQGTIGSRLSRVATELDNRIKDQVIYKLHPGECDDWETRYPHLVDSDIIVVDGDTPSLYELFERCTAQVGVYSTALYEGVAFGLQTFLLRTDRIEFVQELVDKGWATVVDSAADINRSISSTGGSEVPGDVLFEPNSLQNIERYLDEIQSS